VHAALAGLILAAPSGARAQAPASGAATRVEVAAAPVTVTVWNRDLVTLRARLGDVGPAERADRIRRRIEELPPGAAERGTGFEPAELAGRRALLVTAGGSPVIGLFPEDVDPESGGTLEQLAASTAARLGEVLRARAEQRRIPALLRGVALSLAATALLGIALAGLFRLARWIDRRRMAARRWTLLGVDASLVVRALRRVGVKVTRLAAVAVAVYAWLAFVLVQFPYTRPWGASLGSFLRTLLGNLAHGAVAAVPGLFAVLVIFLATRFVAAAVNGLFAGVEAGSLHVPWLDPDTARATRRIVSALIWVFAITVAYPYVPGSESGVFKGISVFAGLVLTLGSSGLVNQVMSGVLLVYSRALRPGDYVQVGEDVEGTVTQVGLLSTKLCNIRREEITVPNAVLVGNSVRNFSRLGETDGPVAATKVTIGYDAPWRTVHALLLRAAGRTPGIRREPRPRVLQRALQDFFVEYELLVHLERPEGRPLVLSELHARIQDAFNEGGVQIMSPHFEAQPERKVVVPPAEWGAAPPEPVERGPDREPPAVGRH
jgi:small-conductance mechanosensitive channel